MTTTVTKTVKKTGGDYSTFQGWESAEQADLVALDQIKVAECYTGSYNEGLVVSGWTTGVNNYINFYVPQAERHDGRSREVSGIGVELWSNTQVPITVGAVDYCRFDGLVVRQTSTALGCLDFQGPFTASANELRLENSIFYNNNLTTSSAVSGLLYMGRANLNATLRNLIVYASGTGSVSRGIDALGQTGTLEISHCTFQGYADDGVTMPGTAVVKNTWSGGYSHVCFSVPGSPPTGSNNASTDTSATTRFTSSLANVVAVNQFRSITAHTEDFHLLAGNSLDGAGTPLAAVTLDIDGGTRSLTAPSIGADERINAFLSKTDAPAWAIADVSTLVPYLLLQPDGEI